MVKTWSDSEVDAKIREAVRERDEAISASDRALIAQNDWRQRWSLSLAVANGAALLAVCNAMLDPGKRPWEVLGGSAFFLAGLVCGGVLPLVWSFAFGTTADYHWAVAKKAGPVDFTITEDGTHYTSSEYRDEKHKQRLRWISVGQDLEKVSGVCFFLGSLYIICMLAAKLFQLI